MAQKRDENPTQQPKESVLLKKTVSLSLMNGEPVSENDRTNGGPGWLSAVELGKLWHLWSGTAVIGDCSARTCARLWSRVLEGYRQGRSFSDFWKSYRPVFAGDPSHRQVGESSGELAHVERFFGRLRRKLARCV